MTKNRINFIAITTVVLSLILIGYIYNMQHNAYKKYLDLAQKNRILNKKVLSTRGLIYDTNHIILTDNRPIINVYITPKNCQNIEQALDFINSFSKISEYERIKFQKAMKQNHKFDAILAKEDISNSDAAMIYSHLPAMPCVSVHEATKRRYHFTPATSNVLGYIGANGVETTFNDLISGVDGINEYEINAARVPMQLLKRTPAKRGYDIELTIDAKLQEYAYNAFGKENGAAVAINPRNGEILALVTHPSFDSNVFLSTITHADYNRMLSDPNLPLLDRATKGLFAPGSTIKPFIAAGALQANYIKPDFQVMDDKGYFIPKGTRHVYRDWLRHGGHGIVDIEKSIAYSCDVFYYKLSMLVGMKKIIPWLAGFGFGRNLVSELPYSATGVLSSPAWKRQRFKSSWYTGDTVMSYIGQGYMLVTPLQLASALSILVNNGLNIQPHLLKSVLTNGIQIKKFRQSKHSLILDEKKMAIIKKGMESVIRDNSSWATGWRFGKPSYSVAAKTGTSQVVHDNRKTKQKNWQKKLRDNAWFIAFAPVKKPKIVLAVISEHSSAASIIARKILDYVDRTQNLK